MAPGDSCPKNPEQPGEIIQPSKSKETGVSTLCPLIRQGAGLRISNQHFDDLLLLLKKNLASFMTIYALLYKHIFMLLTVLTGPFPVCSLVMK